MLVACGVGGSWFIAWGLRVVVVGFLLYCCLFVYVVLLLVMVCECVCLCYADCSFGLTLGLIVLV